MNMCCAFLAAGLFLTGCASLKTAGEEAGVGQVAAKAADPEHNLILTAIEEPQIPVGECGMILWTLDAERPMPVFRFVSGDSGEVVLNGAKKRLKLTNGSGAAGFGVYESLSFSSENALSVTIAIQFGSGFEGGSYLQQGIITVEDAEKWRSVTPVAGIAGCRG